METLSPSPRAGAPWHADSVCKKLIHMTCNKLYLSRIGKHQIISCQRRATAAQAAQGAVSRLLPSCKLMLKDNFHFITRCCCSCHYLRSLPCAPPPSLAFSFSHFATLATIFHGIFSSSCATINSQVLPKQQNMQQQVTFLAAIQRGAVVGGGIGGFALPCCSLLPTWKLQIAPAGN